MDLVVGTYWFPVVAHVCCTEEVFKPENIRADLRSVGFCHQAHGATYNLLSDCLSLVMCGQLSLLIFLASVKKCNNSAGWMLFFLETTLQT